ncbi:NADPH-dependent 7-cyano-7-deazaguanine reductase QueF [Frateuria aurantia]
MTTPDHSPLGKTTVYSSHYDPGLLFPIPRQANRGQLGLEDRALPFHGVDIWNAYELSWLDPLGCPQVALAEFRVPASSPHIIESKSFKLYLNSFSQEPMADADSLQAMLARDLSAAAGAPVEVVLRPARCSQISLADMDGTLLDQLGVRIDSYGPPQAELLQRKEGHEDSVVEETLVSDLLRSNCPVTGQPDWGTVQIRYRGAPIDHASVLRYIVSFREHSDFHEHCVERIWLDLQQRCQPQSLSVYARYTRRGGLDINPYRSSGLEAAPEIRTARQ